MDRIFNDGINSIRAENDSPNNAKADPAFERRDEEPDESDAEITESVSGAEKIIDSGDTAKNQGNGAADEIGASVSRLNDTAVFKLSAEDTISSAPSEGDTAVFKPFREDTAVFKPSAEDTISSASSAGDTAVFKPFREDTAVFKPSAEDTISSAPSAGDTAVFKPFREDTAVFTPLKDDAAVSDSAAVSGEPSEEDTDSKKGKNFPKEKKPSPFSLLLRGLMTRNKAKSEKNKNETIFVPRKRPRSTLMAVFFGVIKILLVLVLLIGIAGLGLLLGIAKAYVDTTPALDISMLTKSDRTSYIYDCNGKMITTLANMEYRDWADIDEIPKNLKNALIAIEDVRFYEHSGLDFKRLFSAVVNTLRNTNTHGGSTITQQLIKNKVLSNVQSYKRKIQEAYIAYILESVMEKDDILEAYMNDVYLGDSNYGFKTAAKDYFGKEMNELSVRECAMLAGMVQKPNLTNPRANTYKRFNEDGTNKMDRTNQRTDVVINAMYNNGFITLEERDKALSDTVHILEKSAKKQLYDMAYYVEYAIYDVVTHILYSRNLPDTAANRAAVEKELRTGGYRINLAVDPEIQNTVQQTISNWENYPGLRNSNAGSITDPTSGITVIQPQASAVIIDHSTGFIKAIIGGREEPRQKRQLNRAYQSSMPVGSAIKPLAVYGPALDIGNVFPGTGILNAEIPITGYGGIKGYPALGSKRWEGITTIRRGLTSSLNIVAARTLFDYVTPDTSAKYLQDLGVNPSRINVDGPGLALGTSGITPLEMAAAYACVANGGVYIEPLSFTSVISEDGRVILDASKIQKSHRVFKQTTAFMLIDMMKDVVSEGTGKKAKIDGITCAGKTGTNEDYTSVYFAGFTGYYTGALWIGHDKYSEKLARGSTGGNSAAPLWRAFMAPIHSKLSDKPIFDVSPADLGLEQIAICPISGKIATGDCFLDETNPPTYDWCPADALPNEYCDMHCCVDFCSESNQIASIYCPIDKRTEKSVALIPPSSIYASLPDEMLYKYIPNAVRTELSISEYQANYFNGIDCCYMHSRYNPNTPVEYPILQAVELINTVEDYLNRVQTLPEWGRKLLLEDIIQLRGTIFTSDPPRIYNNMRKLKRNYSILSEIYPPVENPDG